MKWYERRTIGALVVALVLVGLSFLNDPNGYLGTDTGGKTATLDAMVERGDWSPDVGYWAEEWDPSGRFHPLYQTQHEGDAWVQVTSLPMILTARPLWALGGYRAALLLPIAGTVAAALAAAALARRLGDERAATTTFWVFGLASPLTIYALDLWEHSLGVALAAWAGVLLFDVVGGRRAAWSIAAGALLAAAATMRTEALVYTLLLTAGACLALAVRRQVTRAIATGSLAVAGFAAVWLANVALERAVQGASRTSRAVGAAEGAVGTSGGGGGGFEAATRFEEGLRTTFSLAANDGFVTIVLGVLLTATVVGAVVHGPRLSGDRERLLAVVLVLFTILTVAPGLGFVPGLFAAFPVAAAGLAGLRGARPQQVIVGLALVALPVVWAFQFIGGAGPQWGGRYVLASGFALGVVGVVQLGRDGESSLIGRALLAMSVAVTLMGLAWLYQRSHEVADLFDDVAAVERDALIGRNPFFLREAGPVGNGRRWLRATNTGSVDGAIEVVRDAGLGSFSILQADGWSEPDVEGAELVGIDMFRALGTDFEVVHYEFVAARASDEDPDRDG